MRRLLVASALVGLAACPAPADTTPQIHVIPGKAALWNAMLAPHEDAAPQPAARVFTFAPGNELGGPNAIGRPGDRVLENDEVVFVVDQLGSSSGFAESGGNLVDAADAKTRKDELGQVFTYFGTFPRQALYDALESGTSPDGSAWIEAKGHELYEEHLEVTTRYTLHAVGRALLVETTLANASSAEITLASVGDAIQWGGAEKIAPAMARGFKGPSSGPYVAGVGRFVSYAFASTDGPIDGVSGNSWTDTSVHKAVTLAAGAETSYARVVVVGARADTSSLVSELAKASGDTSLGALDVALVEASGGPIAVPSDARLALGGADGRELVTLHATAAPERLEASLAPGRWRLTYLGGGGRAAPVPVDVDVKTGEVTHAQIEVTRASSMQVACVDASGAAMPCKVTFERTDGAPPPDFGPPHVAGPARNQATAADGQVDVSLGPGDYRVTASRGPEYTLASASLTLAPGDRRALRLSPKRVVDTTGYVGCDFHQHSVHSADSPVALADRVIANAAEGVEVAVASEHNDVVDLRPFVQDLHLERELVSISGDELTSDASRQPWGHANVFPLVYDGSQSRGGAPAVRDRTPREIWSELRKAAPADIVVQINHPRSGSTGYFDLLGFDPKTGVGTSPAYDPTFDAVELWNGRNVAGRAKVLADVRALLRTGHPVTPVANTDTHGIVGQEAGYPRTYVRVAADAHLDAWDTSRTADLIAGIKSRRDVVLTNGPMLRVTVNGTAIGGLVRGRRIRVEARVESAPWISVEKVRVLFASDREESKAVTQRLNASGALSGRVTFALDVPSDDAIVVVVEGSKPLAPVLGGGADSDILPWAMSGPIWIDADGDGHCLGRNAR